VVDEAGYEYRRQRTPMGSLATEQDIAGTVAYLASADATHVTGQLLCVEGGMSASL
jgi:NAD(P)-dependent dehydrogenase (short-subunit alcohol dehydrogenase family)